MTYVHGESKLAKARAAIEAARLAQEWAETRWPETWTTCRARLDAAAKEAATIPDRRTQTKHKQTERPVSNVGRSAVSRMGVAA